MIYKDLGSLSDLSKVLRNVFGYQNPGISKEFPSLETMELFVCWKTQPITLPRIAKGRCIWMGACGGVIKSSKGNMEETLRSQW